MVKVVVKYFLNYIERVGKSSEEFFFEEEITLETLFNQLNKKYSLVYEKLITEGIVIVNDRSVNQLERKNTVLKDGDIVMVMPMISGG